MDIQKEREAFDAYFKDKYPELHKDVFDEDGDDRAIIGYSFALSAWMEKAKAQAVPEGYKVVPVNYECVWCGCTELDGWTDETMIEAQETK